MKVLITGAHGKLGKEVSKLYPTALKPTHKQLDVEDPMSVHEYIQKNKPDVVIHLAAAVAPPKCEKDKDWAWRTNVDGTRNMVMECEEVVPECYFIYMGTPCEFDGDNDVPSYEYNFSLPDNYYGFTKMIGSFIVIDSKLKTLIVRGNFVPKEKWPYPKAFTDRKSNYLFAHQLAKGIKEVIDDGQDGVIHIVGDKVLTMLELAKKCPDSSNVKPYTLEEYYKDNPGACMLTKNMVLGNTFWKTYNIDD